MKNITLPSPHKIIKVVRETQAEYTFRVECDSKVSHGQFFQLSIPKVGEAPISVSGKGDGWLEFTIRKVGRLTEGIFGLQEGDLLYMRGPYGNHFETERFDNKHLLVISGGTGLAPVRSMLTHYKDNPETIKSVHLISGFKNIDCVLFEDDIKGFKECFNTVCTLDNDVVEGYETGLVTKHIKDIPFDDFEDYNVVIVGPPVMMKFAALECIKNGVEEEKMWLSFERKMSCAVGKCGHCKIDDTYVCIEGPVFNYTRAKELLD